MPRHIIAAALLAVATSLPAADAPAPVPAAAGWTASFYNFFDKEEAGFRGDDPARQPSTRVLVPCLSGELEGDAGLFGTPHREQFAARFEAMLKVPAAGSYTFHLVSDDGSMLTINGQTVVDNSGMHGMDLRTGTIDLPAGQHAIRVDYYQGEGGAGLVLGWQGPDQPLRLVATSDVQPTQAAEPVSRPAQAAQRDIARGELLLAQARQQKLREELRTSARLKPWADKIEAARQAVSAAEQDFEQALDQALRESPEAAAVNQAVRDAEAKLNQPTAEAAPAGETQPSRF